MKALTYGRAPAALAGAFLLLALGAGASPEAAAAGKTHRVTIEGLRILPPTLEVAQGDTVVWTNKDPFPHNVTAQGTGLRSPDIAPERSWSFKAEKKGEFDYICTLHPTMHGRLVVK